MFPTIDEARELLEEAEKTNPGSWVTHSLYTAQAARYISKAHKALNPEKCYVLGCLHDIGRRNGVTSMRHIIDGYYYLKDLGYDEAATVCLTHSFPFKKIDAVFGIWDCSDKEYDFVKGFLKDVKYSIYDKLIQLCDALALPSGFCLLEKRMVDVALRHGTNKYTAIKWETTFSIKKQIEQDIGMSIYDLLPGVIKNTFKKDL